MSRITEELKSNERCLFYNCDIYMLLVTMMEYFADQDLPPDFVEDTLNKMFSRNRSSESFIRGFNTFLDAYLDDEDRKQTQIEFRTLIGEKGYESVKDYVDRKGRDDEKEEEQSN